MTDFFEYLGVVGYGRGFRTRGGNRTREPATVVLVNDKLPELMLQPHHILPDIDPATGKRVDVIGVGTIRALRTAKYRPAPGGVSIGHYAVTAGTLGTRVFDGDQRLILSNNHVLANSNDGQNGDAIYQPGIFDGGTALDTIALLSRFVPIDFGEGGCVPFLNRFKNRQAGNLVDAALALPPIDSDLSDDILGIGPVFGTMQATLQMPVRKSGRTTGLTTGVVEVLDAVVRVQYGGGKVATFSEQIITSAMSEGGDSGSLLVHGEENKAVGLLFAGSDQVTIHNSIENVLRLLKVTL